MCSNRHPPPLMKYFKYLIRFAKGEGNQLVNQSLGVSTLGGGDGKELLLAHPGCGQKENLNKKKKKFETSVVWPPQRARDNQQHIKKRGRQLSPPASFLPRVCSLLKRHSASKEVKRLRFYQGLHGLRTPAN